MWYSVNSQHDGYVPVGNYLQKLVSIKGLINPPKEWDEYRKEKAFGAKNVPLTKQVIDSYGFSERTYKPDWDDTAIDYTLENGLVLTGFTQINNSPTEMDSLEGLDGCIYIENKEELDRLVNQSLEDICKKIKNENPNFDIDQYI